MKAEVIEAPAIKKREKHKHNERLFWSLPSVSAPWHSCGHIMPHNPAHLSHTEDLDYDGVPMFSAHVEKKLKINCKRAECWYCNYERDGNGNIVSDKNGNPKPDGWLKERAVAVADKVNAFQEYVQNLMRYGKFEDIFNFFQTPHDSGRISKAGNPIFFTLTGKDLSDHARMNLIETIKHQFRKSPKYRRFPIYHYFISFPIGTAFESEEEFRSLSKLAIKTGIEAGIFGGYMVFHPFRIPGEFNDKNDVETGPHFHVIGFGHLMGDVVKDLSESSGVNVGNMHSHYSGFDVKVDSLGNQHKSGGHVAPVRSVYDTAVYVLSHAGVSWRRAEVLDDYRRVEYALRSHGADDSDLKSFILPLPESNLKSEFHLADYIREMNSLDYFKCIRSSPLIEIAKRDFIIRDSNISKRQHIHPIEAIRWIGILSNSKNWIWGYQKKKPEKYCSLCNDTIKQSEMFFCDVYVNTGSGPPGPPFDSSEWLISTRLKIEDDYLGYYFDEVQNKNGEGMGMFRVPVKNIRRVDVSVKMYKFKY